MSNITQLLRWLLPILRWDRLGTRLGQGGILQKVVFARPFAGPPCSRTVSTHFIEAA